MNEKAKKELTTEDQKVLSGILSKSNEVLTKEERGILSARRSYLTKDELKTYEIKGKVEAEPDTVDEIDEDVVGPEYGTMKKTELVAECEKRNIEVDMKATVAELVELLEMDDNGELVEEEGDEV